MILVHVQLTRVCFLEHWFIFLSYQFYIYIFFSRLSKFKFHRFDVRVVSNLFLKEQLQFRDCTRDMLQIYFINITYNCWNSIACDYPHFFPGHKNPHEETLRLCILHLARDGSNRTFKRARSSFRRSRDRYVLELDPNVASSGVPHVMFRRRRST